MGQQVNSICEQIAKETQLSCNNKYLLLDPKASDITMIRNKVRTVYCSKNIRRTMVGVVKDNTDQDSWFSAKPITVGNSR